MILWQTGKSAYVLIKSSKSFSQPGFMSVDPLCLLLQHISCVKSTPGIIHFSAYGYVFIHVNVSHLIWASPPIAPSF